ncbi:MAG: helix-turn-helix transcriptional regulator [Candidatus Aminicenantes bacterium]|nr:helix-turn-helix transcriptional regulator [Candidatus Aminicenantes bacterium]
MFIVLMVGVWSILIFHQKSRRFPDARLRDLLYYLIFYNIIELEVFLLVYFDSNLTPQQSASFFSWFKGVDWPLRTLLILGLYVSLYKTIAWLRGKKLSKWLLPGLGLFTAALMLLFFLDMRSPGFLPRSPYINFWNLFIWPLNLIAAIWLIRMLAENKAGPDPDRRRANRAFAWLFLLRIPVYLAIVMLNPGPLNYWNITAVRLLALYTNLIPLFWLQAYFIPWAGSLGKIIGAGVVMPSLQKKHGLSAREMEILILMIDGKSYKQMEEALHISIHTVKSHAYSLYRKLKVNNRHQLIHLVSTSQKEGV